MSLSSIVRVFRIIGFILVMWNIEEVFRSFENGWNYHLFFWDVGADYWFWWCLLGGVAILIYAWAEIECLMSEERECPLWKKREK